MTTSRTAQADRNLGRLLALGWTLLLFIGAAARHHLTHTVDDFARMQQWSWLISQGAWNQTASLSELTPLGDHASFYLFGIGAAYRLWPVSDCLLLLQAAALGWGTLICFGEARRRGLQQVTQWLLPGFLFALHPLVYNASLFDFHPEVLSSPLMLLCVFQVSRRGRLLPFLLLLWLSLISKDVQFLFGVGIALMAVCCHQPLKGLLALLSSIGWWNLASGLGDQGSRADTRLSYLGDSTAEAARTLLLEPWRVLQENDPGALLLYLLAVLLPVLLLINKRAVPALAGMLPYLLINLISSRAAQHRPFSHYGIAIAPFLVEASLASLSSWNPVPRWRVRWSFALITACFLIFGKAEYFISKYPRTLAVAKALPSLRQQVSGLEGIRVYRPLTSHFANRANLKDFKTFKQIDFESDRRQGRHTYIFSKPAHDYRMDAATYKQLLTRLTADEARCIGLEDPKQAVVICRTPRSASNT